MSEIIASVYAKMEATGLKEGILFIDEINCVSETLAPEKAGICIFPYGSVDSSAYFIDGLAYKDDAWE